MSATSARIRTTTICNERAPNASLPDVTSRGPPCCPARPGVTSPFYWAMQERRAMTDMSAAMKSGNHGNARPFAGRGAAIPDHRPDRLPDRGRPVRDPGDPALADQALQRHPGGDGFCGQRQHDGNGGRRTGRRIPQPAHRPPARHSPQPRLACDSDDAAGGRARSHRIHDPSRHAGIVHGVRVRADAGLSRRTVQLDGCRRRVCGLYHRQCRQQPDRPAGFRRGCRYISGWRRISISLRC